MTQVVGIDVGAYRYAAAVCREGERSADKKVLRYDATRPGFNELDRWLEHLGSVDKVVMESSGHNWWPLASHLRQRGVSVAVVNPLESKYFAKSRLQRSKSDVADARTLAVLGMVNQPPTRKPLVGGSQRGGAVLHAPGP